MSKILLTGISGFVGKETARVLLKNPEHSIVGLIRPGTDEDRISEFLNKVSFIEIDLCDISSLRDYLMENTFDVIIHIGALRGGRPDSKDKYYLANIEATSLIANHCLKNNTKLVYCSSVGIFGAIPQELPAKESTKRQEDNYYHFTKIRSEEIIDNLTKKGLNSVILRPAITYGRGDYGFPYTLCKLIDKNLMLLSSQPVKIHLTNVHSLAKAFVFCAENATKSGGKYIIADHDAILLEELVNIISEKLKGKKFPRYRIIPSFLFSFARFISKLMKSEIFVSRFELISQSWYYDISNSYNDISLESGDSLKDFEEVINWYKEGK